MLKKDLTAEGYDAVIEKLLNEKLGLQRYLWRDKSEVSKFVEKDRNLPYGKYLEEQHNLTLSCSLGDNSIIDYQAF